jgi:serralysin
MSLQFWNAQKTVNTTTAHFQARSHTTQLTDGSIVVTWMDYDPVANTANTRFQRYDALGNALGTEVVAVPSSSAVVSIPYDIVSLPSGGFAIAYLNNSASRLELQKYSATGVATGSAIALPSVNPGNDHSSFVVLPNGDIAVSYESGGIAKLQIVSAAGVVGAEIDLGITAANIEMRIVGNNLAIGYDDAGSAHVGLYTFAGVFAGYTNGTTSGNSLQDLIALSNGSVAILTTMTDPLSGGVALFMTLENSTLQQIGTPVMLTSSSQGGVISVDSVALADGKFSVAYALYEPSGTVSVYCQTFNANGSAIGAELRVFHGSVPDVIGFDGNVDLIGLADGRLQLSWTVGGVDGSETAVVTRTLDPREGYFEGTAGNDKLYGNNGGHDYFLGGDGNDTIFGYRGNDTLYGDAGNDTIDGGLGDDEIYGGIGNDTLIGGGGADVVDGGSESDSMSYYYSNSGVTVNLATNVNFGGDAEGDTLSGIEIVYGSRTAGDNITGDGLANVLYGWGGNDTLNGGLGNDILLGGAGGDTLIGGGGSDTASYAGSLIGVTINLLTSTYTGGDAAGDTMSGIVNIIGSSGADIITGNTVANVLNGFIGSDFLYGGLGNDTLTGGAGGDTFVFDTALNSVTNKDIITDFSVADDTIWLENAIFTQLTVGGFLDAALFKDISLGAIDLTDRIIYNGATGALSYDADGSGAGVAIQFATIMGHPALTEADFFVI